ncbi:hypothetical protein HAX54_029111 [Datura stramonium]|uniref:Uncharacterized protein n=1 Tax=Datura stramonium TaxID=4076 RepID=A0ABS8RKU9_DATST|nr:hypothetical protein [Datura stramonium]
MSNMEKLILEHMEVMREQLTEHEGSLKRMSVKLIEMMAETTTYNGSFHEKVKVSKSQLQSVVDTIQCMEQEEESQPLDYSLLVDVDVEEVDKSDDVKHNLILELGRIGPHSKHFSTLCLVGDLEIEPSKPMERCVDKEQCPYILKFIMQKTHNDIPHLRAKKYKMQHLLLSHFMFYTTAP